METEKYRVREPDHFHKGPARAEIDGKWCHVDPKGKPIYEEKFENVGPFSEGLAAVKKDGLWYHINMDGTPAYEQRYDYVGSFSDGLARAKKDGKYFFIRPNGKPVNEERFDYVCSFEKGQALVRKYEKWFFINFGGKKISGYDKQKTIREHFSKTGIAVMQIDNDCFINLAESRVGRIRITGNDVYINIKDKHRPLTDLRTLAVISNESQEVFAISVWDPEDSINSRRIKSYEGKELPDGDYNLFMIYVQKEIDDLVGSKTKSQEV